jgi:hypothetical protein
VTEDGVVLAFASDCRPIVSHASNLPNVVVFVGKRALTAIASRWYQGSTSQQCWRLSVLSPLMVVGGASHGTCDASVVPPRACGHQRDHARLRRSPTEKLSGKKSHATRIAGGLRKAPKRGCWFGSKSGFLPSVSVFT